MEQSRRDEIYRNSSPLILQGAWNSITAIQNELEKLELIIDTDTLNEIFEIITKKARRV